MSDTTHATADELIGSDELAAERAGDRPPVVLDVRWTFAGGPDPEAYRAGHIPGAVFVDLDAELAAGPGPRGRHPLPDPGALQQTWRRVGIDDGDTVVTYDAGDGSGAVRAWWLLRWCGIGARVLDGGLAGWPGPLEAGDRRPTRTGTVAVRTGGMPTVDMDAAANVAVEPWGVLLDARAPERYRGEAEPVDPVAGHIPGAVNIPYPQLYGPAGRLRPAAELLRLFAGAGVTAGISAAASCGSGVTACHLVLAGRVAGIELALYPGSYSEWCAHGRPVETAVPGPAGPGSAEPVPAADRTAEPLPPTPAAAAGQG